MDIKAFNKSLIEEFRANDGRVSGLLADRPMLLLTTTGARSGRPHTTPLAYVADGAPDRLVVFASNMGAASHPAWYHNLVAAERVEVELGRQRFPATASVPAGPEHDRLYQLFVTRNPGTEDHQERAGEREIPMVVLDRVH